MKRSLVLAFLVTATACSTASKSSLSHEAIEETLKARKTDFKTCYETETSKDMPKPNGRLVADFVIVAAGSVSEASLKSTTLNHPGVESCILKAIRDTKFPAQESGGNTHVSYPFEFTSK